MIDWLQWIWLLVTWVLIGGLTGLTVNLNRRLRDLTLKRPELPPSIPTVHSCGGLWGRWEPVKIKQIDSLGRPVGSITGQTRSCDGCGFTEHKRITL